MSEKNKLLRCPFCGGEAHVTCSPDYPQYRVVSCISCGLQAQWYHDDEEEAIEHWNTRTSAKNGILKELVKIDKDINELNEQRKRLSNELQEVQ